jgi:hypothetical protein
MHNRILFGVANQWVLLRTVLESLGIVFDASRETIEAR